MKERVKPAVMVYELLHFPLTIMNRLSEIESVVSKLCRLSLLLMDPLSTIIFVIDNYD